MKALSCASMGRMLQEWWTQSGLRHNNVSKRVQFTRVQDVTLTVEVISPCFMTHVFKPAELVMHVWRGENFVPATVCRPLHYHSVTDFHEILNITHKKVTIYK